MSSQGQTAAIPTLATKAGALLQAMLLSDAMIAVSDVSALLSAANQKVIAANGDENVAIAAYSSVAALAPLQLPTLIPQLILQGAETAQAILALANSAVTAALTPATPAN